MKRIKICSFEGRRPFLRGDNYIKVKIHWWNLKIFFSKTSVLNSNQLGTKLLWVKRTYVFTKIFFLFQIASSTPYLQTINRMRSSHPTRPGIIYRLHHLTLLHTSTLSFKQQHQLQTTPRTPDQHPEQCELQTNPLNNVNSRPPYCVLYIIPPNNHLR